MGRRGVLTSVVGAALCVGVLVPGGAPSTAATSSAGRVQARATGGSLEVSTTAAVVRQRLTFTAKLPTTTSRPARLQQKTGSNWLTVASLSTTHAHVAFTRRAVADPAETRYRVLAPRLVLRHRTLSKLHTPTVTVTTEFDWAWLSGPDTVRAGDQYTLTATMTPVQPGREVTLQHTTTSWVDLPPGVEDATGQVTWTRTAPDDLDSEWYRVVVAAEDGVPALTSTEILVQHRPFAPGPVDYLVGTPATHAIALTWNDPASDGYAGVDIVRKTGSTPPTSRADGELVGSVAKGVGAFTDGGLSPATTYSYAVFTRDQDVPTHYGPATDITVRTRPLARAWGTVNSVDPDTGGVMDISCPTIDFCGAVDEHGVGLVHDNTGWSAPGFVAHERLIQISCPTAGFCVAVGPDHVIMYEDGAWQDPLAVDPGRHLTSVDCAGATFCMAVDDGDHWVTYDGLSWSNPQVATGSANESFTLVTCSSATFCLGFTTIGWSFVFDGQGWGDQQAFLTAPGQMGLPKAMDCFSPTSCIGFYRAGAWQAWQVTWDGTGWDHSQDVLVNTELDPLTDMSCVDLHHCVAVDLLGAWRTMTGQTWSDPVTFDTDRTPTALSCVSTSWCTAVDDDGIAYTYDGAGWGNGNRVDPTRGRLTSVSCPTAAFCAAVDGHGNAVTYDGTDWSVPELVDPDHGLNAVSCSSATRCLATDWSQRYLVYDGTGWSDPVSIGAPDFSLWPTALDCTSATFCIVTGINTSWVYDGDVWSSVPTPDSTQIMDVSCTGPTYCLGADVSGFTEAFDGTAWDPVLASVQSSAGGPGQVACDSATWCLHVFDWISTRFDATDWSPVTAGPGSGLTGDLACGSTTSCVFVDGASGQASSFDGLGWSEPTPVDPQPLVSVSCATSSFCMAVDGGPLGGAVQAAP